MNILNSFTSRIIFLASLLFLLTSCKKEGYDRLKGEWVWEIFNGEVKGDGFKHHGCQIQEFDFEKNKVTVVTTMEIEGELIYRISIEGQWNYYKEAFEDPDAIGVIEIEYDLDSFDEIKLDRDFRDVAQDLFDSFKENNRKVERAHSKNETRDKDEKKRYFGFYVSYFGENSIAIITESGKKVKWLRPEAFEKEESGQVDELLLEPIAAVEDDDLNSGSSRERREPAPAPRRATGVNEGLPIYGSAANYYPNYTIGTDSKWVTKLPSSVSGYFIKGDGNIEGYPYDVDCLVLRNGQITGRYHNNYNGTKLDVNGYIDEYTGEIELRLGHGKSESEMTLEPVGERNGIYNYKGYYHGSREKPTSISFWIGDDYN